MTHVCDPVSMPIHIWDRGLSDYHSLSPEPRSPPGVGSIASAAAVEAMMMMIHHLAFTFLHLITLSGGVGCKTCFFFILTLPRWAKDWGKGCRAASVGSLDSNWIPGMLGSRGDPFHRQCKRFRRWLSAEQGWSTGKWSQEGDFILNVILDNV